ncbi:unnamed protein product [Arctogadus glacialis]
MGDVQEGELFLTDTCADQSEYRAFLTFWNNSVKVVNIFRRIGAVEKQACPEESPSISPASQHPIPASLPPLPHPSPGSSPPVIPGASLPGHARTQGRPGRAGVPALVPAPPLPSRSRLQPALPGEVPHWGNASRSTSACLGPPPHGVEAVVPAGDWT